MLNQLLYAIRYDILNQTLNLREMVTPLGSRCRKKAW